MTPGGSAVASWRGRTRPVPFAPALEDVNSAIREVETGQVKARLIFDLQ
jgi:hypothetical protein